MKKTIILLLLFCASVCTAQEEKSHGTLPARFRAMPRLDGGIRVSLSKKIDDHGIFSFAVVARGKVNPTTVTCNDLKEHSPESAKDIDRLGFRVKFKRYTQADSKHFNTGFYHGPYTDVTYAKSNYGAPMHMNDPGRTDKGIYAGTGYNVGYTFKIKKMLIEPAFGLSFTHGSRDISNMWGLTLSYSR